MGQPVMELHLPQQASSAAKARMFVREVLLGWELDELIDDAQLGTSELVANVVSHVGGGLVLKIELGDYVKISVRDRHPEMRPIAPREHIDLSEHGRGLQIIEAVSAAWGVDVHTRTKTVWFTLPTRFRVSA